MSKLNEIFVKSINEATVHAEQVTESYKKSMAFSSIAHALAVYLNGTHADVEIADKKAVNSTINDDIIELSEKNKKILDKMDKDVKAIEKKKEVLNENKTDTEWNLKYDENGIPFLDAEDRKYPERILIYENALTPEMTEKKRAAEIAEGEKILKEMTGNSAPAPIKTPEQTPTSALKNKVELTEEQVIQFEACKTAMNYQTNPDVLDLYVYNFTDGAIKSASELTADLIPTFISFVRDEITKYYNELDGWKNSWITKEGLDNIIKEQMGSQEATIENAINESNVRQFVEYVRRYNAEAFYSSWANGQIEESQLVACIKQYLDDANATKASITGDNVIGFVDFVNSLYAQAS